MSLWNKPVSQITFNDIDAFCKTMQPEGARLGREKVPGTVDSLLG